MVYWESVLKVLNSGLMSFIVEADIFIGVCIFFTSQQRDVQLHFYLHLYWIYTLQNSYNADIVQHSDVNMIQQGIESCLLLISSVKKTDSSESMNSQLRVGWLEAT